MEANTIQSNNAAARSEQSEATQATEAKQAQAEQSEATQATEAESTFVNPSDGTEQPTTFKFPKLPKWTAAAEIGYKPQTTFWRDFSIADRFGPEAVMDTYRRVVREWREDVEYMAELALVLNHKGWAYYRAAEQPGNEELSTLADIYFSMYRAVDGYCLDNFSGDDAEYYASVTD